MTEAEWLKTNKPCEAFAACHRSVSERKARLVSLAACFLVSPLYDHVHLTSFLTAAQQFAEKPDVSMGNSGAERLSRRLFRRGKSRRDESVARAMCMLFKGNTLEVLSNVLDALGMSAQVDRSVAELTALIRCIFGNPFRPVSFAPAWRTETAVALAAGIYADRAFDRLPILADALEESGCDHADILAHCRGPGPHVRGCWVVDAVLGKV